MGNKLISLDQIVTEIKFFEGHVAIGVWEIGKRLIQAKEQVPYGEWGNWLKKNLTYSERTAQNYMALYQHYSDSQSIAFLGYTKAMALLPLDEEEREEVIQDNDIETITTKELEKVVKAKKQAETDLEKERLENVQLRKELIAKENQEPIIKEVIKEVIHPLYEKTKSQKDYLEIQLMKTESELNSLKQIAKNNQADSEKYQKLKKDIETLSTQKAEFAQQLQAIEHLAGLKTRLEQVFTTELLPINYHMDIKANAHSEQVLLSLEESVQVVEKWCSDMRKYLPNTTKGNYIDV